jgi:hypothetical protein
MAKQRPDKAGTRVPMPQQPPAAQGGTPDAEPGPIKRLTLDIPESLHRRLKVCAAREGTTMLQLVQAWIEERVAAMEDDG